MYYSQIYNIVEPFLKSFKSDLTEGDKNALNGYKGDFVYGYRTSGTNIFKIHNFFDALEEFFNTGESDYLGKSDIKKLFSPTPALIFEDSYSILALRMQGLNTKFIICHKGKIKSVRRETMMRHLDKLRERTVNIVLQIQKKHSNRTLN